MAVFVSNEFGWIISHENFVNRLYTNTKHDEIIKSLFLNPTLFDLQIPFVKKRNIEQETNNEGKDVEVVKKAYESLYSSLKSVYKIPEIIKKGSNQEAKSLADEFYCQLTRHPEGNFLGGNNSQEPIVSEIKDEMYVIPGNSMFYCYDVKDILVYLKNKLFDFILLDPPWWNKYIRRKRKKNFKFGYDMVFDEDLSNIPINLLLHKNGFVGVWCTNAPSHITAIKNELFPKWGVDYITQWFWLKVTKFGEPICDFSNSLKKQPFERILFGCRKESVSYFSELGKDKVFISIPSSIHSHKPPLCELLEPYLPKGSKCLELFARYLLPGWTSYGNEVLKLQHMSLYSERCNEES